jgi:hypothetical protein
MDSTDVDVGSKTASDRIKEANKLPSVSLTAEEISDLIAFLQALPDPASMIVRASNGAIRTFDADDFFSWFETQVFDMEAVEWVEFVTVDAMLHLRNLTFSTAADYEAKSTVQRYDPWATYNALRAERDGWPRKSANSPSVRLKGVTTQ